VAAGVLNLVPYVGPMVITAGSALVACGATAAAVHVARWVPITLGALGGALALLLLLDLAKRRV
jgi:hypothetical protein